MTSRGHVTGNDVTGSLMAPPGECNRKHAIWNEMSRDLGHFESREVLGKPSAILDDVITKEYPFEWG